MSANPTNENPRNQENNIDPQNEEGHLIPKNADPISEIKQSPGPKTDPNLSPKSVEEFIPIQASTPIKKTPEAIEVNPKAYKKAGRLIQEETFFLPQPKKDETHPIIDPQLSKYLEDQLNQLLRMINECSTMMPKEMERDADYHQFYSIFTNKFTAMTIMVEGFIKALAGDKSSIVWSTYRNVPATYIYILSKELAKILIHLNRCLGQIYEQMEKIKKGKFHSKITKVCIQIHQIIQVIKNCQLKLNEKKHPFLEKGYKSKVEPFFYDVYFPSYLSEFRIIPYSPRTPENPLNLKFKPLFMGIKDSPSKWSVVRGSDSETEEVPDLGHALTSYLNIKLTSMIRRIGTCIKNMPITLNADGYSSLYDMLKKSCSQMQLQLKSCLDVLTGHYIIPDIRDNINMIFTEMLISSFEEVLFKTKMSLKRIRSTFQKYGTGNYLDQFDLWYTELDQVRKMSAECLKVLSIKTNFSYEPGVLENELGEASYLELESIEGGIDDITPVQEEVAGKVSGIVDMDSSSLITPKYAAEDTSVGLEVLTEKQRYIYSDPNVRKQFQQLKVDIEKDLRAELANFLKNL